MLQAKCLGILLLVSGSLALYSSSDDVVQLSASNFRSKTRDGVWVVEFFAPWCGHCQNLVPEYKKAATALKGVIPVAAVDADEHKSLAKEFQVTGFPTIKIFKNGVPVHYDGARSAQGIVDTALKHAKDLAYLRMGKGESSDKSSSSDVIELTDANFKSKVLESDDIWLVEFYAPWCGHCKNLAPHWEKAAKELKGKVKLGALDATVHQSTASKFGVQGYPTIKYFPAGKKSEKGEDYNGGRTSSDIVNFALELFAQNIEPPEIVQLVSEEKMKQCSEQPLCVVSILPHILDCNAACRNDYINILTRLGDKYKNKLWGWVWAEASAQPDLEAALELGGFGYPALAVVNVKKLKFSTLRGSFSESGINEFLRDLSFGRGQTAPVRGAKMPEIATTEPWDGKDGELPQEEDIDLSDVELDDTKKDEL